jgi:hypothetical protein
MKILGATAVAVSLLLAVPALAAAQTPGRVTVQAVGGVTINYPGHTFSAGVGFSPVSRLDLIVNAERLHMPTTERRTGNGSFGVTRGGTLTFLSGEVRVSLFPPDRVSPFLFAGMGAGTSRPNVNARFPTPVENSLRTVYAGGGVRVPLRRGLSLMADTRFMLGVERENDGIVAAWPLRAGIAWRF